jgi:hypothetical protein
LAFGMALLAKESAVALVLVAAVIAALRRPDRRWLARHEASVVALLAVGVAWANWRFGLPPSADDVPRDAAAPIMAVLFATARFEVVAVVEALLPFAWSPEHATPFSASGWWLVALFALLGAMAWLAQRRAWRLPVLGLAIALAAALPSSPLAGPANRHADRYFFLAVLGGGLTWGVVTTRALGRLRRSGGGQGWYRWVPLLGIALLGIAPLVVVAQRAVAPWKDDATLWSAAVERAPQSPRAWAALSRVHRLGGDLDSADQAVDHALSIEPTYAPARLTRVYNQLARGDVDSARAEIDALRANGARLDGLDTAVDCAAKMPAEARACVVAVSREPE